MVRLLRPSAVAAFLLSSPIVTSRAQSLQQVLFTSWGELCSVGMDTRRPSCLRSASEFDSPTWQPGGGRIVVEAGPHDDDHILFLLDDRGRRIRRLAGSSRLGRPTWSPDGRYIYAIAYELGMSLARWNADGTGKVIVPVIFPSTTGTQLQMISFSPSGARAAILTQEFREMLLAEVTTAGLRVFGTAPRGFRYVSQSVWPDENHVLFVGKQTGSQGELWRLTVADGRTERIGIDSLWLRDQIALCPDRGHVVVTATRGGPETRWNLWTYPVAGGHARRLTTGTEDIVGSCR